MRHPLQAMLALLLGLLLWATPAAAVSYRCGGELLMAQPFAGAVDAPGIPNSSGGTLPGAFVRLSWRDLSLQLPRTNNAGAPSYTDGVWWWCPADPDHPDFRHRLGRGQIETITCERG